jgi:hypothetical protein
MNKDQKVYNCTGKSCINTDSNSLIRRQPLGLSKHFQSFWNLCYESPQCKFILSPLSPILAKYFYDLFAYYYPIFEQCSEISVENEWKKSCIYLFFSVLHVQFILSFYIWTYCNGPLPLNGQLVTDVISTVTVRRLSNYTQRLGETLYPRQPLCTVIG